MSHSQEAVWISEYSRVSYEGATEATTLSAVQVAALMLQLPVLQPWSDCFCAYLSLVTPYLEHTLHECESASENKLVFTDARVAVNSIVANRSRAEFRAKAQLSHLELGD